MVGYIKPHTALILQGDDMLNQLFKHGIEPRSQQIIFIIIMSIESRTPHIGLVHNFLDGDVIIICLIQQ